MVKTKEYVIGVKEVLNGLKNGEVKKVIFASNCPKEIVEKFESADIEKEIFDGDEEELGTYLGRAFPIAVVGVRNEDNA